MRTALNQLYPDKVLVVEGDSEKYLNDKLDQAVKSLKDKDKVVQLVVKLNKEDSVRFTGFSADAEDSGLRTIIASGGLYRDVSMGEKIQHGSLLAQAPSKES